MKKTDPKKIVWLTGWREAKPGDPRPTSCHWAELGEWADVQLKAGIPQVECHACHRWYFTHENHICTPAACREAMGD